MKELFIHIGVHKTGSSAIQHFMDNNRELLLNKHKLLYPKMKGDDHWFQHNFLASGLKKGNSSRFNTFLTKEATTSDRILLSSESFSGTETIPNGMESIKDSFEHIKIIAYLRRQDLWLESVYRQFVKNKRFSLTDTFDVWVENYLTDSSELYSCDWIELLTKWSKVFGTENIIVRPYEKTQFLGGNIIEDFLSIINIPHNKSDFTENTRIHNKSYNLEATDFLRLMNNSSDIKKWRSSLNLLFPNPYHITGEVYLTYEKRLEIMDRFRVSNNKVVETFLPDKKELFKEALPEKKNYPPVFQGLDKERIIPEIELIIDGLEGAKKQIEQQHGGRTNRSLLDNIKLLLGKSKL